MQYSQACVRAGVGAGGAAANGNSPDSLSATSPSNLADAASERMKGRFAGPVVENPLDRVATDLGVPMPSSAFVPLSKADNFLNGPSTDENIEGIYRPDDPGFGVLAHEANRKVIVLGRWLVEQAQKTRLPDGSYLGALGPEAKKADALPSRMNADDFSDKGSATSSGSMNEDETVEQTHESSRAFEWNSLGRDMDAAKSRREAKLPFEERIRIKRLEAEKNDLASMAAEEEKTLCGAKLRKAPHPGDLLMNHGKIYLAHDWLYLGGVTTHDPSPNIPPSAEYLEASKLARKTKESQERAH